MASWLFRASAAAAIVVVGGSAVVSQALDNSLGVAKPALALRMGAQGAETRARAAQDIAEEAANPGKRKRAEALARSSLRKDPTVILGWTTLAMLRATGGDLASADAILSNTGSLTQRDLPSQLWLIDQRVRQGNIADALNHYDIALRTSPSSDDLLLPILVQATREPRVAAKIVPLLKTRPNWEKPFLVLLAEGAPNYDVVSRMLVQAYGADQAGMSAPLMNIARKMADQNAAEPAWRLYNTVAPQAAKLALRNGSFETSPKWPPFDWELPGDGPVTAAIGSNPNIKGERALDIRTTSDAGGDAARQLLSLKPGDYRITATAGGHEDENVAPLRLRVVCSGIAGRAIVDQALSMTGRPTAAALTIPEQGCGRQILMIEAGLGSRAGNASAWLDRVAITAARPATARAR